MFIIENSGGISGGFGFRACNILTLRSMDFCVIVIGNWHKITCGTAELCTMYYKRQLFLYFRDTKMDVTVLALWVCV